MAEKSCGLYFNISKNFSQHSLQENNLTSTQATLTVLLVAFVIQLLSITFNVIRKWIYNDNENLNVAFDAGGKVSAGLTTGTIVAAWTWSATLLQSSTVTSKYGISGAFWYAAGASIQILLFSILAVQLKIRAPGAKTFLQVIRCRFGKWTHIIFCFYALLTNVIVLAMLMLGGTQAMITIIDGYSIEFAAVACATIIACNCLSGGLGATFYASYFQSCGIIVIILLFAAKIFLNSTNGPFGSVPVFFETLSCVEPLNLSRTDKVLSMESLEGFMFGVINLVGNFGTIFVDQVYWQSAIAAKPKQAVLGFLTAGIVWFAVPHSFATTMGLGYLVLSVRNGSPVLDEHQVDNAAGSFAGLVAVAVASYVWGRTGKFLLLVMVLLAVTSTGASEIIAIDSILLYDVYMTYIKPFRHLADINNCILCGKPRGRKAFVRKTGCTCKSIASCTQCTIDDELKRQGDNFLSPRYQCLVHNRYREYMARMQQIKRWLMLATSILIIPLTMILFTVNLNMDSVYLFMGIIIGSAVFPVVLCLWWVRMTGIAMVSGAVGGTVIGLISWLIAAYVCDSDTSYFLRNLDSGKEYPILLGNVFSMASSGILVVIVSHLTNKHSEIFHKDVWERTKDIDNPIYPWTDLYKRELKLTFNSRIHQRPLAQHIEKLFAKEKCLAIVGSITMSLFLIFVCPIGMMMFGAFNLSMFKAWVGFAVALALAATIYLLIMPVVGETILVLKAYKKRKLETSQIRTLPG